MDKLFGTLVAQFRQFYDALPPLKRKVLLASSVLSLVGVFIVSSMLLKTDYVPLFRNVNPDQLPHVISNLRQQNIPFKIDDNGNSILVPRELLPATQMAIMSEMGGSQIGSMGLELFENQDFGITSYAQRINYQRAIQGELMRSINTLSSVRNSKVLLALPNKKTFLEEGGQPTASVVLELHPGRSLSSDQVKGITHLVASSVENLDPGKVTVVDERGKVLSRRYDAETAGSSHLLELKQKREREMEERIESVLSRVVGNGKVIARVNVDLNPRTISSVEELIDNENTAIRSQVTEEESLDGARNNPTGIPGARANLPGAEDQGTVGFQQNVRKELTTTNFAVPKTVRNIREAAGDVQRVSVAVLVDGSYQMLPGEGEEVTETWVPRTEEEIAKFENIVRNAIGFSPQRGDAVQIENIRFEIEDFSDAERLLTNLQMQSLIQALFKWSILGLSLALLFFIVIRPFMRWITDSFQDTVEDMLPRTIEELEELQAGDTSLPGMTGALPVLEESIDPNKAESELLKERIMNIMEEDIEKTSAAFNMWVARRDN